MGCFYKTLKLAKEGEELKVLLVHTELNALGAAIGLWRVVYRVGMLALV